MDVKFTVESHIDIPKTLSKIENKQFWTLAAETWQKLIDPYVPFDTGALSQTFNINATETGSEIEYTQDYAVPVYEKNKNYVKGKEGHLYATAKWDKVAEPVQKPKLIDSLQTYVDSGRINLND